MRITLHEAECIVENTHKVFGTHSSVTLFGSRVDNTAKGGDIDLYVETDNYTDLLTKKINFLTLLEETFGEQKIDLVFKKEEMRKIDQEVEYKGIVLDIATIKLEKYFRECEKHIQRIDEAYDDMKNIIPLSVEKYINLSKDEVQDIDQFLFRFSKLQDTMGDKIFKLIFQKYEGTSQAIPFIDMLNRLEKLGCITSAKEWMHLRKLRNEVAHQYDDEAEEMTQAINALLFQKEIIKTIFGKLKSCSQN